MLTFNRFSIRQDCNPMIPFAVRLSSPLCSALLYALTSAVLRTDSRVLLEDRGAQIRGMMLLLLIIAGLGVVTLLVILFAPHIR